jgi:hypothetical protein
MNHEVVLAKAAMTTCMSFQHVHAMRLSCGSHMAQVSPTLFMPCDRKTVQPVPGAQLPPGCSHCIRAATHCCWKRCGRMREVPVHVNLQARTSTEHSETQHGQPLLAQL